MQEIREIFITWLDETYSNDELHLKTTVSTMLGER